MHNMFLTCSNHTGRPKITARLTIGGPDDSVTYRCFEWEPCSIEDLEGPVAEFEIAILALETKKTTTTKTAFEQNRTSLSLETYYLVEKMQCLLLFVHGNMLFGEKCSVFSCMFHC